MRHSDNRSRIFTRSSFPQASTPGIQGLRAAYRAIIAGVAAAVSHSDLASNVMGMAADKGQAMATQNYASSKIWKSPWVRAMTEITQKSLYACAQSLRIVLLGATALTESDKYKDPLLLDYVEGLRKGHACRRLYHVVPAVWR